MSQPLTSHHVIRWIAPSLSDPSPHERFLAVRLMGDYSKDLCVCQELLAALQDPAAMVRIEAYQRLSQTKFSKYDGHSLLEVARHIRRALELEEEGSPAWFAGRKALDRLSDYYEENLMFLKEIYCPIWHAVGSPF